MKTKACAVIMILLISAAIPGAVAQVPPLPGLPGVDIPPPSQVLQPITDATGYNYSREDINITLLLNFTNIEIDVPKILLSSGKIRADLDAYIRIEIRVICAETIYNIMTGQNISQPSNDTENNTENATMWSKMYIPADAFRATLTADLLALFISEEEKQVNKWIEGSFPGAKVTYIDLEWENSSILTTATSLEADLREPPLVIIGEISIRYIVYASALPALMDSFKQKDYGIEEMQKKIALPKHKRGFFGMLSYDYFMYMNATPGWQINFTIRLPPEYTFEYVNYESTFSDRMHVVSFVCDAKESPIPLLSAYVASITNRGMVLLYCFMMISALTTVIGIPIRHYQKKRLMKKIDKKIAEGLKKAKG